MLWRQIILCGAWKRKMVFARKTKRRIAVAIAPDEWRMETVSGVLNNTIIVSALCLAFSVSLQTTIGKDEACLPLACALCYPLRTAWSAQFGLHASAQLLTGECSALWMMSCRCSFLLRIRTFAPCTRQNFEFSSPAQRASSIYPTTTGRFWASLISTRSNAWRCRPTAASLSRLWESPYRMINSLQLTPCSTTRYRRPRYCQRCECSLVRHSRPSSVCSDQGV